MSLIRLDLNNPVFQGQWFSLEKEARIAVLNSCIKLASMDWNELYRNKGFHWELIQSKTHSHGEKFYSLRITQKIRVVAKRSGNFLQFLTLHTDHDSAHS